MSIINNFIGPKVHHKRCRHNGIWTLFNQTNPKGYETRFNLATVHSPLFHVLIKLNWVKNQSWLKNSFKIWAIKPNHFCFWAVFDQYRQTSASQLYIPPFSSGRKDQPSGQGLDWPSCGSTEESCWRNQESLVRTPRTLSAVFSPQYQPSDAAALAYVPPVMTSSVNRGMMCKVKRATDSSKRHFVLKFYTISLKLNEKKVKSFVKTTILVFPVQLQPIK